MQTLGSGSTDQRPIRLGGALVTIVDPHRGHEIAYNRWYERDHFYAGCMIGAWSLGGARYVATRDLKALRYPSHSTVIPDASTGSYLSLYWVLAGKFGEWMRWASEQVAWLHDNDRMFAERDHLHTLMYRFDRAFEDVDGVPVELALDHRSPYVVMVIGQPGEGIGLADVADWFSRQGLPSVVGAQLTPIPLPDDAAAGVRAETGSGRFCQLWFVDAEITEVWDDHFTPLGRVFADAGLGQLLWVSPFRATVPGTDIYTDELW